MNQDDLNKLWQQIDADLDQDDDIEVEDYLQQKGFEHKEVSSLKHQANHLINNTFSDTELSEGQLHSKYKIIEQIDSGGQSDVYLAERSDGVYQQTVVIKFISGRFEHAALKQQFLQEMQLLADLHHPGVVTIIDGNITTSGRPWLVLEYIDGLHIDLYVKKHQLNIEEVVKLMTDLCDTLQFVHNRKVFHKDLKPGNVLVKNINGVPYPVLIDFGIAMQQGEQVELNFGTQGYSAPEQIKGQVTDQRTDLYALGVLFARVLVTSTGQSTASGVNILSAVQKASISADLLKVIRKLTAEQPEQRYQSAEALRSDLNQWQQGFPLSFDNHKLSTVLGKTVKRHPWITFGLFLVVFFGVFFTIKYTRDVQHLQELTVAEKNATDELMNFMLDDLYESLERIGRIDVLQRVAEKSVDHLGKQDQLTLDEAGHRQAAKAYVNTGRVFDYLEQSEAAQKMFLAAERHLEKAFLMGADPLDYYSLRAKLKVYQSQVLSSEGQEHETQKVLEESVTAMNELLKLRPESSQMTLWEASLELGYHLMEYAQQEQAEEQISKTVAIAQKQLSVHPNDADWLYAYSHSLQMKAWYELDFGQLEQGIIDTIQAIELAQASIVQDNEDLKKQNNERILHNQLAFFYLESQQLEPAKSAALKAIELGNALKLKAPFNQEFEREQAYSFSTAGEIYQQQGYLDGALNYYQQGLAISKRNYEKDPSNYSAANDLAVDSLLVAGLQQQLGDQEAANQLFVDVEQMMEQVHTAEPNNKYYAHTLLVAKLHLKKFDEAKPLFELAKANDIVDGVIEDLLKENNLDWQ
ncbi:MAG: protein kinase [Xanthomonadales bacterium]|nr:protein kinase [Xanthomonadales bacterium]